MFIKKIGIDLGTTYTLVYLPGKGIVINEPSVVAHAKIDKRVLAVGEEAKEMLGRTPDTIIAARPLKDGVIADYRTTEAMLRYFINKALGSYRLFRPEVMVAVPAGITSTERRAVIDATIAAGGKTAYIIKEPIAAAIGASIPIGSPSGHMIVDIGGGTAEIQGELEGIIAAVKSVLSVTPPELSADVIDKGMVLSGGSSLLRNMDKLLSQATGVPAFVADDALLCVAKGTGIALDNLDAYKRSILAMR